jgi:hypothetical protein
MSQIPLSKAPGVFVTVDPEDFEWLSAARWFMHQVGYAARCPLVAEGRGRAMVLMHREILGLVPGDGLQCDHINGDKLDNRRSNLRAVSQAENLRAFKSKREGASSRYRGVCWVRDRRLWLATARLDNRQNHLGRFASEEEAAAAVNAFWVGHGYAAPNVIEGMAA